MAQLLTVRMSKSDAQPLGFRLQGGKDFGTPLVVQKVNVGSAAERAGLQAGDALIRVNNTEVFALRHQDAQDTIRAAGPTLELCVQRGGGTWRPSVTPTGSLPRPGSRPLGSTPTPVTQTSLKANHQPSRAFGSGHNNVAKPFGYMNGNENVKSIVNKQYNTPVNMYSDQTIAETLSAQTEVLAGGVLGVNFKKNEKHYDAEKSAVFKVLQEEQNDPEPVESVPSAGSAPSGVSGLRSVQAPAPRPEPLHTGGLPHGQNICEDCERLITGVFVRIKDKNLHVECFKCATCGTSLKNQGYYNLNGKLYCDIHAKLVARQNPPASNLDPVTVPPGGRIPTNAYSTPLPPLSTGNYTNGSSSLFSPSSNMSGPKPFGSSLGSAYSPSLSPRSAPLSPARPQAAFTPAAPAPYAPAYTPAAPYAPAAPANTFAPTNEQQIHGNPNKPEYKSAAEERLIKKMAKMALNGYEIGIQRKIKPADHIQSMADKIQDTVVTKHPLNSDNVPSDDNSRENTLGRPSHKNFDKIYNTADSIQSIGDKIKETIMNKHPAVINSGGNNIPPPPPIPTTPIPNFNAQSTPIPPPMPPMNIIKKPSDFIPKSLNNTFALETPIITNIEKPQNSSGYSSSDDSLKENGFTNTLRNKSTFEKSFANGINTESPHVINKDDVDNNSSNTLSKRNMFEKKNISNGYSDYKDNLNSASFHVKTEVKDNNFSNTLNKRKMFENKIISNGANDCNDSLNGVCFQDNKKSDIKSTLLNTLSNKKDKYNNFGGANDSINARDKRNNGFSEAKVNKAANVFERAGATENGKLNHAQKVDENQKPVLPQNLYDNTLYTTKSNGANIISNIHNDFKKDTKDIENYNEENIVRNGKTEHHETETDVVVKRRQKKPERHDDGRRDSHIVARPKSTMTSVDVGDGQYPVCHICEKEITRGPFITALGRIWCPDHFVCTNASCRRPLQDIGFVEENGQLYCEYCFEQYIAPACDKCHAKIKGDCLNAIGKHFHPECFNCVYCGKLFGNNPFFLEDGLPYCESDWNELFTTKCFACGFPVEAGDRWVEALNNNYHSQCFNCTVCKKNLEGQSFFAKGGRPFCKMHAR